MSRLVAAYEQLLLDNVSTVSTVESAIRNVTWFLPGRFNDADIASEGLYSLLSVVSSVHDRLLEKRIPQALSLPPHPFAAPKDGGPTPVPSIVPGQPPSVRIAPLLPAPSEHARYTRYWSERSPAYRRASRALTTITYIELLSEMVAKRRAGDRVRWRVVLGLESIKTFLRLLIVLITKRPALWLTSPQREYDVSSIPQDKMVSKIAKKAEELSEKVHPTKQDAKQDKDSVRRPILPAVGTRAPLRTHLYPLVASLPDEYQAHPPSLVPELSTTGEIAGEVLSVTAVWVQVILLLRAARSPKAPRYYTYSLPTLSRALGPFLIPLLMQVIARRLRVPVAESTLLAEHYAQVDRRIASRVFFQGPMWIGWTRPKIVRVINVLNRVPLISLAGDLISGYLPLVDDYFYTIT